MKKLLGEFKKFCLRGNVMDLAVGVMIGGAFGKIVTSVVNDLFMPLIGLLIGGFDLSSAFIALDGKTYATQAAAAEAGAATLNYGTFVQTVIDFLLMAICVFFVVKLVAKLMPKREEPPKKPERACPFCRMPIADDATRCPHCTSELVSKESK